MPTESNSALSAAIDDLLAENASLKARLDSPNQAQTDLDDETSAEDALTAKIKAALPPVPEAMPEPAIPAS